jgi:hypothetical protein
MAVKPRKVVEIHPTGNSILDGPSEKQWAIQNYQAYLSIQVRT